MAKNDNKKVEKFIPKIQNKQTAQTGTALRGGRFFEEYLGALQTSKLSYSVYDKMRRADPQVKRLLKAISTPILGATFTCTPIDFSDLEQQKQADFKKRVLYNYMAKSWTSTIGEIITFLPFGFSAFEPVFQISDTKEYGKIITIKKLVYIKQKTVYEWIIEDGAVVKIRQLTSDSLPSVDKVLDAKNFLFFVNEKEGDNFEGVSILRSCYGSYIRKDLAYKIDMIGLEKMAIGTPVAYVPKSILSNDSERDALIDVLENYTSHESQYIFLDMAMMNGGFEIVKGEYDANGVNMAIDREDTAILSSVLASFLDIGTKRMGGNSQSTTLYQMFIDSLECTVNYICEKIDPLLNHLYDMNFGAPEVRLKLKAQNVSKKNQKEVMDILSGYTKAGLLSPDRNIEAKIRSENDLPEIDPAAVVKKQNTKNEKSTGLSHVHSHTTLSEKRQLTEYEKKISLSDIETLFSSSEAKYKSIIRTHLEMAKSKYMNDLDAALKVENPSKAVMNLSIGFMGQLQADLKAFLKGMMAKAQAQAAKEVGSKGALSDILGITPNVSSILTFVVRKVAEDIESDFQNKSTFLALNYIHDNEDDAQIKEKVSSSVDTFIDGAVAYSSTGAVINQFVNTARNNFFFEHPDIIQGFQYSAIIDSRTTPICQSLDGKTFEFTDSKALELRPPLHWNCRSILIAITMHDKKPEWTGLQVSPVDGLSVEEVLKGKQF